MPHFLVKPKHIAWLTVLFYPLVVLYSQFLQYRSAQLRRATINSQRNRLTQALRDEFLNDSIYLQHNSDYLNQAFIYLEEEGASAEFDYLEEEGHQPESFDFLDEEYELQYDFIVRIPQSLSAKTLDISAFVKRYVFTSIRYKIELF